MKYHYILYSVILSTLFFFNHSSNADTLALSLPDGTTWTGELGQSVHVEYRHLTKNEIAKVNGSLVRVAESYIFIDDDLIFIEDIVLIQNSTSTKDETPPAVDPPLGRSSEVSKDGPVFSDGFDWVVVRGVGITSDEAKQDAWRNAIEHVAGVYITANSLIENGKLVKDIITSHSNAFYRRIPIA